MKRVSVLGLGAMGSRMAANLIAAGFEVTVWNRDGAKAMALARQGAAVAATPRAAAMASDAVLAMVRDDEASARVWLDQTAGAFGGMKPGAIAIESSTLQVSCIARLADAARGKGIAFLDAPVVGSRNQAEARQLIHLVGGDAMTLSRAEPILKTMGGAIHHIGTVGSGTALKLAINALFAIQVASIAELTALLSRQGVDVARAVEVVGATPVASPAAKGAAAAMLVNNYAPQFPVELALKDLSYMIAGAAQANSDVPMTTAAQAIFERAATRGLADENLTAVRRLYG